MVAATWNWDSLFMAQTFGWKATLAVLVNATFGTYLLRRNLGKTGTRAEVATDVPTLVVAIHLVFLSLSSCWRTIL